MTDAIVAGITAVLYLMAVYVRAKAGVDNRRLRWWYYASLPLGLTLALNQVLVMTGSSLSDWTQAATRALVIAIVWIGPASKVSPGEPE